MSTSNNSKKDEFQLDVDSAIDNLFNPSREIEIDPQSGEVKEAAAPEETPLTLSLEKDAETSSTEISFDPPDIVKNPHEKLLGKLEESFMALDWEVSSANIKNFQELLQEFKSELKLKSQSSPGKVALLMDEVLEVMEEFPDQLPTTAIKTLQKGLVILREAADSDQSNLDAADSLAQKTIVDLEGILGSTQLRKAAKPEVEETKGDAPAKVTHLSLGVEDDASFPEEMLLEIPDEPVSNELSNTINLHLSILSQCINRILPLEKLFSQNDRYSKLLSQHREMRELFEEEKDIMTSVLISDYKNSANSPGTNIPTGLFHALEKHLAALQKSDLELQTLVKAFSEKKGYEKLSDIEKSIQFQLQNQIDTLKNVLEGKEVEPGFESTPVPAGIADIVREHMKVLSVCVKNILPMENLFGKTKGYEKLHSLQKRIREQLAGQEEILSKALAGTPQSQTAPASSDTIDTAPQKTPPPCPVLRVGYWGGERVGFVPEQIVLENPGTPLAKKLHEKNTTSFALKSLSKWPWSKLKPLFQNELANMEEKQLAAMDIPVLNNPSPIKKQPEGSGKETLVLLYHNENGAAAALDGPTEELVIDSSHSWQPADCAGNKMLIGYLLADGSTIPVISL